MAERGVLVALRLLQSLVFKDNCRVYNSAARIACRPAVALEFGQGIPLRRGSASGDSAGRSCKICKSANCQPVLPVQPGAQATRTNQSVRRASGGTAARRTWRALHGLRSTGGRRFETDMSGDERLFAVICKNHSVTRAPKSLDVAGGMGGLPKLLDNCKDYHFDLLEVERRNAGIIDLDELRHQKGRSWSCASTAERASAR